MEKESQAQQNIQQQNFLGPRMKESLITYPVSPVTCIITICLTIEILHSGPAYRLTFDLDWLFNPPLMQVWFGTIDIWAKPRVV